MSTIVEVFVFCTLCSVTSLPLGPTVLMQSGTLWRACRRPVRTLNDVAPGTDSHDNPPVEKG